MLILVWFKVLWNWWACTLQSCTVYCWFRRRIMSRNCQKIMKQQIPFEYCNKLQWTERLVMGNCSVRQCQLCDDMMVCLNSSWEKVDPMQPSPWHVVTHILDTAARPISASCPSLLGASAWCGDTPSIWSRMKGKVILNCPRGSAPSCLSELLHLYSLHALSALHQTHACANSNASTAKPVAFALSHTSAPTSGKIPSKTSGTRLLSLPSKANSRHFSSQNISAKQCCPASIPVCTVCVCVCVCARVCMRACVRACVSFT